MKTLLRILFGRRLKAPTDDPLFRFYLTEYNATSHVRHSDNVHI